MFFSPAPINLSCVPAVTILGYSSVFYCIVNSSGVRDVLQFDVTRT